VNIFARYRPWSLEDSIQVTILQRNPVNIITLIADQSVAQAGSGDSVTLRATAFLQSGAFAPVGTLIYFEVPSQNGHFDPDAREVGQNGIAESHYVAGQFVGDVMLRAYVQNPGGEWDSFVYSNEIHITLLPGPPSSIRVRANPATLNAADPLAFSTIFTTVTDTAGNPVQDAPVRLTCDKGYFLLPGGGVTDTIGSASARFYPGAASGIAIITASVDVPGRGRISSTCTVTIVSSVPNSIEVTADPIEIAVWGTGGHSISILSARLFDQSGNVVERAWPVVFQLLNNPVQPMGCNINDRGDLDSARLVNGVAVATLNAGVRVGPVLLRVYTWRDPDSSNAGEDDVPRTDTVSCLVSPAMVVAGPPVALDLDVNRFGEDAGGGLWELEVSARVWDYNRNPVADGIPVVFTVDPAVATIDPGYTGNDLGGGSARGVAFSRLLYHSTNTFNQITFSADVQSPDGLISADYPMTLPLQRGYLQLHADPGNWMFDRERPDDTCLIRVWVVLTDGHGVAINSAPILFGADRGMFYWRNLRLNGHYIPFYPDPARGLTGYLLGGGGWEDDGVSTVYLRGVTGDFFLNPLVDEASVRIEAEVEGIEGVSARPTNVMFTRH